MKKVYLLNQWRAYNTFTDINTLGVFFKKSEAEKALKALNENNDSNNIIYIIAENILYNNYNCFLEGLI